MCRIRRGRFSITPVQCRHNMHPPEEPCMGKVDAVYHPMPRRIVPQAVSRLGRTHVELQKHPTAIWSAKTGKSGEWHVEAFQFSSTTNPKTVAHEKSSSLNPANLDTNCSMHYSS